MSDIELKKEIQQLKSENERLRKQLADALSGNVGKTVDHVGIVQQVQGLLNSYLHQRSETARLQGELDTRNEDNRRLQKILKDGQK